MATEDLTKEARLKLSDWSPAGCLGHSRQQATGFTLQPLSDEERRAMSALQDLYEHALLASGIGSRPKADWDRRMESAKAHVRSMPLEFENSWPRL